MTAFVIVAFAVAAGLGAGLRYVLTGWIPGWMGTLAVNATGSFLLGWLMASDPSQRLSWVLGTAFCGSFTTFSTFALNAADAAWDRRALIIAATMSACLAAASLGYAIG